MSRTMGDAIIVRPSNNVYTALLAVSVVVEVIAVVCVILQYSSVFGKPLFAQ